MNTELYEETYQDDRHFSFGKNWQEFLRQITPERIEIAKQSLTDFLGSEEAIRGKTFVDVGCGSGLFSLAAYLLGAKSVLSIDVDQYSIACAKFLSAQQGNPKNWRIIQGSALDKIFVEKLGKYDVVYSWGVLHHTGDMKRAIANTVELVAADGVFYLAIYNDCSSLMHGTSAFWTKIKRIYNQSGSFVKNILHSLYINYLFLGLIVAGRNPGRYIRSYRSMRGMSWRHDILDWLGGYPYEYSTPESMINFLGKRDLACSKLWYRPTIACNEYLFCRSASQVK